MNAAAIFAALRSPAGLAIAGAAAILVVAWFVYDKGASAARQQLQPVIEELERENVSLGNRLRLAADIAMEDRLRSFESAQLRSANQELIDDYEASLGSDVCVADQSDVDFLLNLRP